MMPLYALGTACLHVRCLMRSRALRIAAMVQGADELARPH
jgi:hypothetical protein